MVARQLRAARGAPGETARRSDAVWTVSRVNAAELKAEGIDNVGVSLPFTPQQPGVAGP